MKVPQMFTKQWIRIIQLWKTVKSQFFQIVGNDKHGPKIRVN